MQKVSNHIKEWNSDASLEQQELPEGYDATRNESDKVKSGTTQNGSPCDHGGEPAPSQSWDTLSSSEEGYDAELYGVYSPGRLFIQTNVNVVNTVRHVSWSVSSTIMRRTSSERRQVDEESALALLNRPCQNYGIKCKEILNYITKNPQVADLKISLYMVASEAASLLKPFPRCVVEESLEGTMALSLINEEIPSVNLIKYYLTEPEQFRIKDPVVNLLHWLLVFEKDPKIQQVPPECFYSMFLKVKKGMNYDMPTFVFKLMASSSSPMECKWRARKEGKKSSYAFYGDSLKVMHSLIHLGFYPLTHTEGIQGSGLYFYTDLKYCLDKPEDSGWCWGKSELGRQMKTVLVVEILEDPDCREYDEYQAMSNEQKAITNGSGAQELPCYYVPRSDLVRIRYILIFTTKQPNIAPTVMALKPKRTVRKWIGENKKIYFVFGSLIALAASARYLFVNKYIRTDIFTSKLAILQSSV